MDRYEAEHKIAEAQDLLKENRAERAELWMTRLLAEDFDMPDVDAAAIKAQATDLMGRAQFALGRYNEALDTLREASQSLQNWLANRQFDSGREEQKKIGLLLAASLENLCFGCMERNLPQAAEAAGREALAVARQYAGEDAPELARALFGVSLVWYRQKDFKTAESMLEQARSIFEKHGDFKMAAFCLNNLGRIYEEQGDQAKGVATHKMAVELRRKLPDRLDLAFSLGNLGAALASSGDWNEGMKNLEEALQIYREVGRLDSPEAQGFAGNLEICKKVLEDQKK